MLVEWGPSLSQWGEERFSGSKIHKYDYLINKMETHWALSILKINILHR